jgi:hypothetical protein
MTLYLTLERHHDWYLKYLVLFIYLCPMSVMIWSLFVQKVNFTPPRLNAWTELYTLHRYIEFEEFEDAVPILIKTRKKTGHKRRFVARLAAYAIDKYYYLETNQLWTLNSHQGHFQAMFDSSVLSMNCCISHSSQVTNHFYQIFWAFEIVRDTRPWWSKFCELGLSCESGCCSFRRRRWNNNAIQSC